MRAVVAALLGGPLGLAAIGHEDLERQIGLLTARLGETPGDAELLLRRADLHRRHREWDAALADYRRAGEAGADRGILGLGRAQLELDRGMPDRALKQVRSLPGEPPRNATAGLIEARALAALGRRREALTAYDRALGALRRPQPDHYLERARLEAGDAAKPDPRAIAVLDAGAERLGEPVSLHQQALDWERRLGRHEAALARCGRVLERSPENVPWLIARAEVLAEAGRNDEALEAWRKADAVLRRLPARRARSEAGREWRLSVDRGLAAAPPGPR